MSLAAPRAHSRRLGVLTRLERDQATIAARFLDDLQRNHPLYASLADELFIDLLAEAMRRGVADFADWALRHRNALPPETEAYYRMQAEAAAGRLIPLQAIVDPVEQGMQRLWHYIVESAGADDPGRRVALDLVADLSAFSAAVVRTLTDAYVAARFEPGIDERRRQQDLVERLVAGVEVDPERAVRLSAAFSIDVPQRCMVSVACALDDASAAQLALALGVLQQQGPLDSTVWALRPREIVAIFPEQPWSDVVDRGNLAVDLLRRIHGVRLVVGVSTGGSLGEIPARYLEAKTAAELALDGRGSVVAMGGIGLFDYVTSRFDATAHRIVPDEVRTLAVEDERSGGALTETLVAFADNDLHTGRTAAALFVHPNTVQYRLKRVVEITGRNPKRFRDLVDLLVGLRGLAGR